MNIEKIISDYLESDDYDGLFNESTGCACLLNDLFPCGGDGILSCKPGYKMDGCTEECGLGCEFHVGNLSEIRRNVAGLDLFREIKVNQDGSSRVVLAHGVYDGAGFNEIKLGVLRKIREFFIYKVKKSTIYLPKCMFVVEDDELILVPGHGNCDLNTCKRKEKKYV